MATIQHHGPYYIDFGAAGLAPQQAYWISFGPFDPFDDATVTITAGGGNAGFDGVYVLSVADIFRSNVSTHSGGIVFTERHAGANITNGGSTSMRYMAVYLSLIRP